MAVFSCVLGVLCPDNPVGKKLVGCRGVARWVGGCMLVVRCCLAFLGPNMDATLKPLF